jgi:glycosyltransferase involved in cell wall biosynthesis
MPPLVSVIVTVYRRTDFLRHAIGSAISQTFSDREIIVADDSGSSLAKSICAPFCEARQLIYHANAKTFGIVGNLRGAIESAQGKYIAILNDDDFWTPTFLEKLVAPLEENPNRVIAFSDHWIVNGEGVVNEAATDVNTLLYDRATKSKGEIQDPPGFVLIKNGVPLAMSSLFRKDALELSLLTKEVGGSYDFWIACVLAATGKAFYYVPERLTFYRVHSQMETVRKSADKNLPTIFIAEQLLERNWFPSMRKPLRHRLSESFYRNGRDLLWFGQPGLARKMFLKAIKVTCHRKSAAAFVLSLLPRFVRQRVHLSQ